MMYEANSASVQILGAAVKAEQSSLQTILGRLNVFIEQETDAIGTDARFDYKTSSERKSRLLLELNRASRSTDPSTLDTGVLNDLRRLKSLLRINEAKIKAHLTAIREVSDIMVGIIKNEDADGTYSNMS